MPTIARSGLAIVLAVSGVGKLLDREDLRTVLFRYAPLSVVRILVWIVPVLEVIASGLLVFSGTQAGNWISLSLLCLFTAYLFVAWRKNGTEASCACLGAFGQMTAGPAILVRNALLLIAALYGLAGGTSPRLGDLHEIAAGVALGGLILLVGVADVVVKHLTGVQAMGG